MTSRVEIDYTKVDPFQLSADAVSGISYAVTTMITALNAATAEVRGALPLDDHLAIEGQAHMRTAALHSLQSQLISEISKVARQIATLRALPE